MNKYIFLFIYLFSFSFCYETLPMKKNYKYGDDICQYYDKDSENYYVKACGEGKYCAKNPADYDIVRSTFYTCLDVPKSLGIKTLGESCNSDFECEEGLECKNVCTKDCGPTNKKPYRIGPNDFSCVDNANRASGSCYNVVSQWVGGVSGSTQYTYQYESVKKGQTCGHITKFNSTNNGIHSIQTMTPAEVGTLEDGEYVTDAKLCKSGFALYFYADQKLIDDSNDYMYLMCVTPTNVFKHREVSPGSSGSPGFIISYTINGGEEYLYNSDQLSGKYTLKIRRAQDNYNPITYSTSDDISTSMSYDPHLLVRAQRFKEYIGNLTDASEREKCGDLENDQENILNCNNKDVLKAWYFYKHPNEYLRYVDKEDFEGVVDYMIQQEFYSYPGLGNLLNMNFLILIGLLFLL